MGGGRAERVKTGEESAGCATDIKIELPEPRHLLVEGHEPQVMDRAAFEALASKMHLAGDGVERLGADEAAVLAAVGTEMSQDEDVREFVRSFILGQPFEVS